MPTSKVPQYVGRIRPEAQARAVRDPYVEDMNRRVAAGLGWEPHVLGCRTACREYERFHRLSSEHGDELWDAIKEPDRFPELKPYRKVAQIAFELECKWGRAQDEAALAVATWYVSHQRIPWWRRRQRSQRIHKLQASLIKTHLAQAN